MKIHKTAMAANRNLHAASHQVLFISVSVQEKASILKRKKFSITSSKAAVSPKNAIACEMFLYGFFCLSEIIQLAAKRKIP